MPIDLKKIPINREPITAENGALQAYVMLVVAGDMRADGMPMFADILERGAGDLVVKHGRLAGGTYIPPDIYEAMYESIVAAVRQGAEATMASMTKH